MDVSEFLKAEMFAPETDVVPLELLTITHPELNEPIRVVNNQVDVVSRGNTFRAFPFRASLPKQGGDEEINVKLEIDNVDRQISATLRDLSPDKEPRMILEVVTDEDFDTVEGGPWDFRLQDIRVDKLIVQGTIGFESKLSEPFPAHRFTPALFPGLF